MNGLTAEVGNVIAARYELLTELPGGPLRRVFLAFDREVEVEVTLWLVDSELFGGGEAAQAAAARARGIRSPHALRLFGHELCGGSLCLAWQLGTNAGLHSLLESGVPAEPTQLWRYASGLASALQATHAAGIVHAWLCPADVVEVAGQVKLCGIGLLSDLDATIVIPKWGALTRYVAPELVAGGPITATASSDWYSLGMILLDLATGRRQETREQAQQWLAKENPELALALEPSLRSDASQRPLDAQSFLAPLERICMPSEADDATTDFDVGERLCDEDEEPTEIHRPAQGAEILSDMGAISMKPAPKTLEEEPLKPSIRPIAKPVLRSLSSLPEAVAARRDLGTLAAPKSAAPTSRGRLLLYLALALTAGAGAMSFVLVFLSSADAPLRAEAVKPLDAVALPSEPVQHAPLVLSPPCVEGMILHKRKQHSDVCIDQYESPGKGRTPQSGMSWQQADSLCHEQKKRLCTAAEWEHGCRGNGIESWPYGDMFQAEICNTRTEEVGPSGAWVQCETPLGVHDMSGNIAEWVARGEIRGGSAGDQTTGRCSQVRKNPGEQEAYSDVGFRCCADAIASDTLSE